MMTLLTNLEQAVCSGVQPPRKTDGVFVMAAIQRQVQLRVCRLVFGCAVTSSWPNGDAFFTEPYRIASSEGRPELKGGE